MKLNLAEAQRGVVRLAGGDSSRSRRFARLSIPTSASLTGLEVRLSQVLIKDNKTPHVWPFIRYADLYVLTSTVDNLGGEISSLGLKGFADVDDGEQLAVERTIYYWKGVEGETKVPGAIHTLTSILKSNEGIREVGAALTELRKSTEFQGVVGTILSAATGGGSAIFDAFLPLVGVVGQLLGKVDDTPLFTTVLSFTDISGDFDNLGRHPYPQNNRYVELVSTLIVRDETREGSVPK
jgi:hypothetical protein